MTAGDSTGFTIWGIFGNSIYCRCCFQINQQNNQNSGCIVVNSIWFYFNQSGIIT